MIEILMAWLVLQNAQTASLPERVIGLEATGAPWCQTRIYGQTSVFQCSYDLQTTSAAILAEHVFVTEFSVESGHSRRLQNFDTFRRLSGVPNWARPAFAADGDCIEGRCDFDRTERLNRLLEMESEAEVYSAEIEQVNWFEGSGFDGLTEELQAELEGISPLFGLSQRAIFGGDPDRAVIVVGQNDAAVIWEAYSPHALNWVVFPLE